MRSGGMSQGWGGGHSTFWLDLGVGHDFLPVGQLRGGLLCWLAVSLAFPWTVDAVESYIFSLAVVQDFDNVATEDADDLATQGDCVSGERL
jgi:hypothetical protein